MLHGWGNFFLFVGDQFHSLVWVISAGNQFSISGRFNPTKGVYLATF